VLCRAVEQRLHRRIRHVALEPGVDFGLALNIPAREEGRQRQLWIDDQIGAPALRFVHQRQHPPDDDVAPLGTLDRAHLGGSDVDHAHGAGSP